MCAQATTRRSHLGLAGRRGRSPSIHFMKADGKDQRGEEGRLGLQGGAGGCLCRGLTQCLAFPSMNLRGLTAGA